MSYISNHARVTAEAALLEDGPDVHFLRGHDALRSLCTLRCPNSEKPSFSSFNCETRGLAKPSYPPQEASSRSAVPHQLSVALKMTVSSTSSSCLRECSGFIEARGLVGFRGLVRVSTP